MTCRFSSLWPTVALLLSAPPAFAGHAGDMDGAGLMPHELLMGLVGLAALVLFVLLAVVWVIRRVRGLERRLRDLEGTRKS